MASQDEGQFRQLSQPSIDPGEDLFMLALPLSQIKAAVNDQLASKQHLQNLSSKYHRNVSKEVTKSIIKYLKNDIQKYNGFASKKYYYNSIETGHLFSVIYKNSDSDLQFLKNIILDQSRIFQSNCKEQSKQEYYSYWIIMRFNRWLQDSFPNV